MQVCAMILTAAMCCAARAQGNEDVTREISVVCRIRPLNAKEIRERSDVCTNVRCARVLVGLFCHIDCLFFTLAHTSGVLCYASACRPHLPHEWVSFGVLVGLFCHMNRPLFVTYAHAMLVLAGRICHMNGSLLTLARPAAPKARA